MSRVHAHVQMHVEEGFRGIFLNLHFDKNHSKASMRFAEDSIQMSDSYHRGNTVFSAMTNLIRTSKPLDFQPQWFLHCFLLLISAFSLLISQKFFSKFLHRLYRTFCYHLKKFTNSVTFLNLLKFLEYNYFTSDLLRFL